MVYKHFALLCVSLLSRIIVCAVPLQVTLTVQDDACGNSTGCITAHVIGGYGAYSFLWAPAPGTGQGTGAICELPAGSYSVTVTDSDGNTITENATVVAIPGLLIPSTTNPTPAVACEPGCNSIWTTGSYLGGLPPYSVVATGGAITSTTNTSATISGLCTGLMYDVTVTDANGCFSDYTNIAVLEDSIPVLLSQSIQGACLGANSGTAIITLDRSDVFMTVLSGICTLQQTGDIWYATGLPVGQTVLQATALTGFCYMQIVLDVQQDPTQCGTLNGRVFADLDGNCIQDATDPGIPNYMMEVEPDGRLALTDILGDYELGLVYGSHTLQNSTNEYDCTCLTPFPAPFDLTIGSPTLTIDVAETFLLDPDVSVYLTASQHQLGMTASYTLVARNHSPNTLTSVELEFTYDPSLTFSSVSGGPDVNTPGYLHWNLPALPPYGALNRSVFVICPTNIALLGTNVNATATIIPSGPDEDATNNSYSANPIFVAAYDPNDKRSLTSTGYSEEYYFLDVDTYVDHTVRFQNTGTASAQNVHIIDTISPLYDLASFNLLGASHAMVPTLLEDRTLRFDFANIQLPDSNANEPESHGFVSYRMKPVNDFYYGQTLVNTADIFFDFNPAVRTNTTSLTADYTVGLSEPNNFTFVLFPNPVNDQLEIRTELDNASIDLLSIDGRIIQSTRSQSKRTTLNVSGLAAGSYMIRVNDTNGSLLVQRFVKN